MNPYWNPALVFFVLVAAVWMYRCRLALQTLDTLYRVDPERKKTHIPKEKVTIFVPAKNEESNIEACVISLANQSYENYEIRMLEDGTNIQPHSMLPSKSCRTT